MSLTLYDALFDVFTLNNYVIPKNTKNIDKEKLISYLATNSYNPNILGYSCGGLAKFLKKVFPDRPTTASLNNWLLAKNSLKFCAKCSLVKNFTEFNTSSIRKDSLGSQCKSCAYESTKVNSKHNSAKRRAAKKSAMPKWVDVKEIRLFYSKCPPGYAVDHIVPLQGKYVCGLHVLWNLQYLPITENIIKKNKHTSDSNFL